MPTNYEKLYQKERHVLGKPSKEFVGFFDNYTKQKADVLDIGCGQGRDAIFIARLGHRVVGVDISETGIAQLLEDAQTENLAIEGVVADVREYKGSEEYDVIVIDRTLHMLKSEYHLKILEWVSECIREGGFVLIADEKRNIPRMKVFFEQDKQAWEIEKDTGSFVSYRKGRTE